MAKQGRDLQTNLEKEGMTMGESERQKKERDLANLNREFQRLQREFREDLNMRRNEELAQVQEKARKAIQALAESEKFDIILESGVVFVSPKIDITDRVMKSLEK
jgi:outer membrane protein